MSVARIDHWLGEAERIDFPLHPVIGARATVFVLRLAATSRSAAYGLAQSIQRSPIGLQGARSHWKQVGVPQLVAAVNRVNRSRKANSGIGDCDRCDLLLGV